MITPNGKIQEAPGAIRIGGFYHFLTGNSKGLYATMKRWRIDLVSVEC